MASKTYEVSWVSSTGASGCQVVPASSMGAALCAMLLTGPGKLRFRMDIERGGSVYESIITTVTRVS